ncbi:hypothetical protein ACFLVN_02335 [Chloroflexota bacterium]
MGNDEEGRVVNLLSEYLEAEGEALFERSGRNHLNWGEGRLSPATTKASDASTASISRRMRQTVNHATFLVKFRGYAVEVSGKFGA